MRGRIAMLWALGLWLGCLRPSAAIHEPGPVSFRDCGNGFHCATLTAPIDHESLAGPTLDLAVTLWPVADPARRIGVLFVNPGGPGISAVEHLRASFGRYESLHQRFDLVAFDTRGTGGSAPLDCHESLGALLAQDPEPKDAAGFAPLAAASRALADECSAKHGALLPFMGTRESARDMDLVRAALGEAQLSYLGFSYGTALGASYAAQFPARARAVVLDGAIDPSFELTSFAREQAVAVEAALGAYDAEAAQRGWNGKASLEAVYARAPRKSEVLYAAAETLPAPDWGWRALGEALGAAEAGDWRKLETLSDSYFGRRPDGSTELRVEAQLATLCADMRRPESPEAYLAALPELAAAAPHFGVANFLSHLPCAFWPEPAHALGSPGAFFAPPVLVVANDGDPLTPHAWGERLAARFRGAARLDVASRMHTAYARGDACADHEIEAFLFELTRPEAPAHCP
jgi:pimeloyl-ACP methyl ester carboxylesterase